MLHNAKKYGFYTKLNSHSELRTCKNNYKKKSNLKKMIKQSFGSFLGHSVWNDANFKHANHFYRSMSKEA